MRQLGSDPNGRKIEVGCGSWKAKCRESDDGRRRVENG